MLVCVPKVVKPCRGEGEIGNECHDGKAEIRNAQPGTDGQCQATRVGSELNLLQCRNNEESGHAINAVEVLRKVGRVLLSVLVYISHWYQVLMFV